MVPEVAGLSVEEVDKIFEGPWFNAFRNRNRQETIHGIEDGDTTAGNSSPKPE